MNTMLSYVIHSEDVEQILEIVYDVLQIGVSFYDKDFNELPFIFKGREAEYCSVRRKKNSFLQSCKKSDKHFFDRARETDEIQVYHCHAGLLDGIIPLFDEEKHFLGGLIFGQVRPADAPNPHETGSELAQLYNNLPQATEDKLLKIGKLLKLTTELIVNKRLVEIKQLGWSAQLKQYIQAHIHQKITLDDLAEFVGKSPSFITHRFKQEFGLSLSDYVKQQKMSKALQLLESGLQVTQTAQRLGYYDAYHFSKAFKQHYGKPPKEFRKIVIET